MLKGSLCESRQLIETLAASVQTAHWLPTPFAVSFRCVQRAPAHSTVMPDTKHWPRPLLPPDAGGWCRWPQIAHWLLPLPPPFLCVVASVTSAQGLTAVAVLGWGESPSPSLMFPDLQAACFLKTFQNYASLISPPSVLWAPFGTPAQTDPQWTCAFHQPFRIGCPTFHY